MRKFDVVLGALALAIAMPSAAATIVDTGAPPTDVFNYILDSSQWLAGKFSTGAATITDVLGFIHGNAGGTFHVALYTSFGATPGDELFSTTATFSGTEGFEGASGLNWTVASGDYFAAFEVRPGDTLVGRMRFYDTPNPLSYYAYSYEGSYLNMGAEAFGVRVLGDVGGGVPEPASWALLIAGFGLTGAAMRRRRNAAFA